jgi:hypothetical protein
MVNVLVPHCFKCLRKYKFHIKIYNRICESRHSWRRVSKHCTVPLMEQCYKELQTSLNGSDQNLLKKVSRLSDFRYLDAAEFAAPSNKRN